jgi:Fe-S cluster assembly protein SufD
MNETNNDILTQIKDRFLNEKQKAKGSASFVGIRENALAELLRIGLPNKKNEKYKYNFLTPLFEKSISAFEEKTAGNFKENKFLKDIFSLQLQDGVFKSSDQGKTQIACSLTQASEKFPDLIKNHLGKYAVNEDGFVSLNTMFFTDGLFLYIPKSLKTETPIQIINQQTAEWSQSRQLVIVEENAEAEIYLFDLFDSQNPSIAHTVTEIFAGSNSRLTFTKIQKTGSSHQDISHIFIHQEKQSSVKTLFVTLDGQLIRNNLNVVLNGEGAEHNHHNLFIADKSNIVDNFTLITHAKPNCSSDQMVKGILKGKSTGVFNGKIYVCPDAQKTVAYQRNDNLLLGADARMNTRPQLEIYADDVKCSHGDTVGNLDAESMFYLRSRGIGEKAATSLLVQGFAEEILEKIKSKECREMLTEEVMKRLE